MQTLPNDVYAYNRTPSFTDVTIPDSIRNEHTTKAGVWGILTVEKGQLRYIVTEPGYEEEHLLHAGQTAVIAPQHKHYVKPHTDSSFYVAFYR